MSNVSLSLKNVLVPSKAVTMEFPGYPGFEVELNYLSRETVLSIRKKTTTTKMKSRQLVEETNDELFLELYVKSCIKGWKGFKLSYLQQLAPVDLSAQKDLEAELEYTEDNALYLMKSSVAFDQWVSEQVNDLGNFQNSSVKK